MNDALLLRRYVVDGAQDAFTELVQRHVGFVYHVALRHLNGNAALAEDATHAVFIDLARKTGQLGDRPLVGWLYKSVRFAAAKLQRTETRRQRREWEAHQMKELDAPEVTDADWQRLRPVIDEALDALDEPERSAVLLRFFEGRTWSEVGDALGLAEDTVRKRLDRALEKMADVLGRRGIQSTGAALATALATQATLAAPAGLTAAVSGAALASGATVAAAAGIASMKTTLIAITAVAVVTTGAALFEFAQAITAKKAAEAARRDNQVARAALGQANERVAQAEADLAALERAVEAARRAGVAFTANVPSAARNSNSGPDLTLPANSALIAYLGNPVLPPSNLNSRYTAESLAATFRLLSNNANLPVRQLFVDTTEYPFLIYGSFEGLHNLAEIQKGLETVPGYAYSGSTSGRGTWDGKTGSFFAINIIPRESGSDPTGAANRRLMVRLAMLQERARQSQ